MVPVQHVYIAILRNSCWGEQFQMVGRIRRVGQSVYNFFAEKLHTGKTEHQSHVEPTHRTTAYKGYDSNDPRGRV